MKLILRSSIIPILLMSSLFVSAKTKIDTIDFWHVYYNQKVIAKFDGNTENKQVTIEKSKIKPNDILSIEYGNDAPGDDIVGIYVKDRLLKKIKLVQGKANFSFTNRLNIPIAKILDILKSSNLKTINFYYYDIPRFDHSIFTLKVE